VPSALVNGVRLNYVQMAAADIGGPHEDLVMVHGLATNLAFWYFHYAAVFARRYRVTVYDLRGHGRSEMPAGGYTPANLARDLECLLDHLAIPRAHFLVHSFGGGLPSSWPASRGPDRQLGARRRTSSPRAARGAVWTTVPACSTCSMGRGAQHPRSVFRLSPLDRGRADAARPRAGAPGLEKLVGPLVGNGGSKTAAQWLRLMQTPSAEKELMGEDGLSLETLRRLRFPILAMYGDNSQARLTGEELLRVWPHAEFRRVRDAGHFFPSSRPAEVIHACSQFWRGDFGSSRPIVPARGTSPFPQRALLQASGWYCLTREGGSLGPFISQEEASEQLDAYISTMAALTAVRRPERLAVR
jgi:pimeloyl-ACP methyl ester carboxylesterase